jgi:AcrR family transcriptional regulator
MNKSARTRHYILERTAPLFNSKGFSGTSLTDLMEATGLTKGALYGNFRDKEEIAAKAFGHAVHVVRERVRQNLEDKETYKGRLLGLFEFYAGYVLKPPVAGGCPLLNTAIEADDHHKFMRKAVRKELVATIAHIQQLLDKGIAAGEFRHVPDTRALAFVFFCSVEGAIMFSRVERSPEAMNYVVGYCRQLLDQISN